MGKFIREILPVGIGLPIVIFMASVGPDEAASNIAKWANRFGFENLPPWMTDRATDRRTIILALATSAVYLFLLWAFPRLRLQVGSAVSQRGNYRRMIALIGMIASAASLVGFTAAHFWPDEKERPIHKASAAQTQTVPPEERKPLSMREIFDSDFPGIGKIFVLQEVGLPDGTKISFPATEYWDIATNSYFLSFYLNSEQHPIMLAQIIASAVPAIVKNLGQTEIEVTSGGDTRTLSNATMKFAKEIYLYYDRNLSIREMSDIESMFTMLDYQIHIFTASYHILHWREFERSPIGATALNPVGAQLPKASIGTLVTIHNRTGSLPPTTPVQTVAPPQTINPLTSSPRVPAPPDTPAKN